MSNKFFYKIWTILDFEKLIYIKNINGKFVINISDIYKKFR